MKLVRKPVQKALFVGLVQHFDENTTHHIGFTLCLNVPQHSLKNYHALLK